MEGKLYGIQIGPWVEIRLSTTPLKLKKSSATVKVKKRVYNPGTRRYRTEKSDAELEMAIFEGGSVLGHLLRRDFIIAAHRDLRNGVNVAIEIPSNRVSNVLKALGRKL